VTSHQLRGVLFDMDGTIIDSEPYWMRAERELVESFGGTWGEEQAYALVGSGLWNSASLLQSAGVALELDDIVHRLSDRVLAQIEETVPWRPGVRELFSEILEHGIPWRWSQCRCGPNALALADAVAREMGQPVFQAVVAGDDVTAPKPNPEAYLQGQPLWESPSDTPWRSRIPPMARRVRFRRRHHDWNSPARGYSPHLGPRNVVVTPG
jgi:beta-phosphoglucomutase-like phosphatase (HAD superfamily)